MKKKFISFILLTLIFCFSVIIPVSAASNTDVFDSSSNSYIECFDDGSYVVISFKDISNKSTKTGTKTATYYSSSDQALCAIKITATFSYNGSTVSCVGTSYNTYSYDSAWNIEDATTSRGSSSTTQTYATASGNAIKRLLGIKIKSVPLSITIYCDKNGNLS